ncbi:MAG: hypothetical protein JXA93_17975 [Anaerolineae bacterium]|nr:hypothetical protein [Anaerolineae bacterium]
MHNLITAARKNRTLLITLAVLALLLLMAIQGLTTEEWVITMMRGFALGAITFLVASGLSLIFGLLDVLNLAHGTLFMIGAYVGWTMYIRPDTFVDVLPPVLLLVAGLTLKPVIDAGMARLELGRMVGRILPWVLLIIALVVALWAFVGWPIAKWDPGIPIQSPNTYALQLDQSIKGGPARPMPEAAAAASALEAVAAFLGGMLLAAALSAFARRRAILSRASVAWSRLILPAVLLVLGVVVMVVNTPLSEFLFTLSSTAIFLVAILVTILVGAGLGGLMEVTLIRPLYERPIYQLMLTLGIGVAGIELVQAIWGRPEFTMPKPALFAGAGDGCPAATVADWLEYQCSTFLLVGGRLRVYNEVFLILVGVIVLVGVWLLLQRSRIGMVIRAGVQDSDMVEALGINVRQVFTFVFALGASLAALGGVVAGPSTGLSPLMGESLFLSALIALVIGGLTSFPGAAAGSLLVGLLQQFIIRYGQNGINLPFLAEPFKPTPPLVPASTVLLMVIILLLLPQGLFGRRE